MADAPPRFFVDPGGCRRERVAPKRPAPRDLRPVVHSAYEDENKQGLGYNEHDPRHGLRLGRVLVGGVVTTSRSVLPPRGRPCPPRDRHGDSG